MPVNLLDIILAVPLIAMAIKGLKNGFVHEVFSLLGQIIAIFLAFTYMDVVGNIIIGFLGISNAWIPLLGFVALYLVIIILVNLLIKVLNAMIKFVYLSNLNMIAGAIFSTFKAVLVISVIFLLFRAFDLPNDQTRESSLLYRYIAPVAPVTYNVVANVYPGVTSFAEEAGTYIDRFSPFSDFTPTEENEN